MNLILKNSLNNSLWHKVGRGKVQPVFWLEQTVEALNQELKEAKASSGGSNLKSLRQSVSTKRFDAS